MDQHILFFLCVTSYIVPILGQSKLGDCPKADSLKMCGYMCFQDAHCRGDTKCCKNACGGFTCVPPVAVAPSTESYMPQPTPVLESIADVNVEAKNADKKGVCPSKPTGPWVCTNVCTSDNDCRGSKKCCKNRCGAFTCTNPTPEQGA